MCIYVCDMYLCMYASIYACMYVYIYVIMFVLCIYLFMYACINLCKCNLSALNTHIMVSNRYDCIFGETGNSIL